MPIRAMTGTHFQCWQGPLIRSFISFIHYEDIYSISLRLLLRSAADPNTAKNNSFKAKVGFVSVDLGEQ